MADDYIKIFNSIEKSNAQIDIWIDEEYYEGIRCVAAPITAGGKTIASISITGSIFTVTSERIENELINQVMKTGKKISEELKW